MARVFDWLTGRAKREPKGPPPLLLVGIGNPGEKYAGTRHNIGFACIDLLADRFAIRLNDKRKEAVLVDVVQFFQVIDDVLDYRSDVNEYVYIIYEFAFSQFWRQDLMYYLI